MAICTPKSQPHFTLSLSIKLFCQVFAFLAALGTAENSAVAAPVHLVRQAPVRTTRVAPGVILLDFGRAAYGNLRIVGAQGDTQRITVRFGEALVDGRINRKPPGTVRYAQVEATLDGSNPIVVAPKADGRNTKQPEAVLTPAEWGVVTPFRWVEMEGWPGDLAKDSVMRQAAFLSTWDDTAASFHSSDAMLDRIWELCRYSIKATSFAGIYVDGDRERIPYEADAYLNQISQYYTDNDLQMARDTFDRLMQHPTWPTEWASHMIFIAHADWMRTGDAAWLAHRYEGLKTKLKLSQARADGLIVSTEQQIRHDDIVDWPTSERDGYVFRQVNTVVNAFHLRALALIAELAAALNKDDEAAHYRELERTTRVAFQEKLFDRSRGAYRDGEGTDHASQHANLFALAFGLVPAEFQATVRGFVLKRGMACSVYAAQYLMEGLFQSGAGAEALALITAPTDRSWRHMVESGTTITWEAWDQKYKPNQDWNHAWGAAPANLLPRFVLGVQPLTPGCSRVLIRPCAGGLKFAEGKVPTIHGPVMIRWTDAATFKITVSLPKGVHAHLELPATEKSRGVRVGGRAVHAHRVAGANGALWILDEDVAGRATIEVK